MCSCLLRALVLLTLVASHAAAQTNPEASAPPPKPGASSATRAAPATPPPTGKPVTGKPVPRTDGGPGEAGEPVSGEPVPGTEAGTEAGAVPRTEAGEPVPGTEAGTEARAVPRTEAGSPTAGAQSATAPPPSTPPASAPPPATLEDTPLPPASTQDGAGPVIELAAEDVSDATPDEEGSVPAASLRAMKQRRLSTDATGIGGYGELHYGLQKASGPGESQGEIDLHRLVIFLSHNFNQNLSFYSEVEVEHAFVGDGKPGEVGVEQAAVDFRLVGDALGLRAGVVLVPMGIINQWHEPPSFHGVERPSVDKVIIPSTWREGGVGIFGEPSEWLRYEIYLVGGLNAESLRTSDGIRKARQGVAEAHADGLAVTGRVELEPRPGLVGGLSGYFGLAGPNAELFDAAGERLELDVPVWGGSADLRGRAAGFEARAVVAAFGIGDTVQLRDAHDKDGAALGIDVGSLLWGTYGELAYDVLHALDSEHQLLPFVRLERYDTLSEVEGRDRTPADDDLSVTEVAFGLSYRPAPQVVFKGDYILKSPGGPSETTGQLDLGVGVMF